MQAKKKCVHKNKNKDFSPPAAYATPSNAMQPSQQDDFRIGRVAEQILLTALPIVSYIWGLLWASSRLAIVYRQIAAVKTQVLGPVINHRISLHAQNKYSF